MSPGCRSLSDTWVPWVDWSCETRGRLMPTCLKAVCTRPEQSYADGPVAPETYALPICALTKATTAAAEPVAVEVLVEVPESVVAARVVRSALREARAAASLR